MTINSINSINNDPFWSSVLKSQYSQNNTSIFKSISTLNAVDYKNMSDTDLSNKLSTLRAQKNVAMKYPELESQYNQLIQPLIREQETRKYTEQFDGNTTAAKSVANISAKIEELNFTLESISQKRETLSHQMHAAAEQYPALAAQYHLKNKELETDEKTINSQINTLKSEKADQIKENTPQSVSKPSGQNKPQTQMLMQFIMMLIQMMMGGSRRYY